MYTGFWWGNLRERNHLSELGVYERIILKRGVHRVLVGKPEGKTPLGRPRRRGEDNIKTRCTQGSGGET